MRFAPVAPETTAASGPDLTRYVLVCLALVGAVLFLAWLFRRFLAGELRRRASRRSLQVLDVLPLGGRQRLMVVRCYDRSFLLGLGDKEVRSLAELDVPPEAAPVEERDTADEAETVATFATTLAKELPPQPPPAVAPAPAPARRDGLLEGGILG